MGELRHAWKCIKQTKKHTHAETKSEKTKENRKTKETKEERQKENVVVVNNICGRSDGV